MENNNALPGPEYELLDAFTGAWDTSGLVTDAAGNSLTVKGTDTYEWLPGGYFLLHKVDVLMGNERRQSIEIIGYDAAAAVYTMQSFGDRGDISCMKAGCADGVWTFEGAGLRFTGSFTSGNSRLSGEWQQLEGTVWRHLMNITLNRKAG